MRAKIFLLLAGAVIFQFFLVNTTWACGPYIAATAACSPTTHQVAITYTSTSWAYNNDGLNSDVRIFFNDVQVDTGAYTFPNFSFSNTLPAPAGTSAVVTAKAEGTWGNGELGGQTASVTIPLPDPSTDPNCSQPQLFGRFTGGGHQISINDVKVTRGFTLHCDIILSNNLEVNWKGNSFHMTEYPSEVTCSDDPAINPVPPPAPVDTITGVSMGRYNGTDGYKIEFTFKDAGEPGTSGPDQAALKIYEAANPTNVVLDLPLQPITGGNVQAHYDQPHQ